MIIVFLLPLPRDLPELRRPIIVANSEISRDMLQRVWVETDYQFDVCCVTKGGNKQLLRGTQKILESFSFHL